MRRKQTLSLLCVALILLLTQAACYFSPISGGSVDEEDVAVTHQPSKTPADSQTGTQKPTKTPQSEPERDLDELYATAPDSIEVASGGLQLVDLFAFW